MRILDKTIDKSPWAQMTPEQRDELTSVGALAPWMFRQGVVLTVVDDTGEVAQFDGEVAQSKPTFVERLRAKLAKKEGR